MLLDAPGCVGCKTEGRPPGKPKAPAPGHIGSMGLGNIGFARPMLARELMLGVGKEGVVVVVLILALAIAAGNTGVGVAAGSNGALLPPLDGASFFSSVFFLVSDVDIFPAFL